MFVYTIEQNQTNHRGIETERDCTLLYKFMTDLSFIEIKAFHFIIEMESSLSINFQNNNCECDSIIAKIILKFNPNQKF